MAARKPAPTTGIRDVLPQLRRMAEGKTALDVAQLQFVELGDIQRAYGTRWPEQKERIQEAAEAFLRKRIGGSDLLVRGDGGFLLVFGADVGADAHAVTAQLTQGLNAFFLGRDQSSPSPQFGGAVEVMPARNLEAVFGDLGVDAPEQGPVHAEKFGLPGVQWRFEPVWDVRRETLSHWYVAACFKANGARVPGYQFENGALNPAQLLKIDEANLWVAEQALSDLFASGKQTLIGSTVHVGSLASLSSRARILANIDRLNSGLNRFRILKIAGVAPGFPRMYLREIVGILRARLPNVVISAVWDEPDVAGLVQAGPTGLGFVVPTSGVVSGPVIAIPALMTKVADAVRSAHAGRTRFFVEGAVTKYLALKLSAAGVDNLASPGIWPARPAADGMLRWPAEGLKAA